MNGASRLFLPNRRVMLAGLGCAALTAPASLPADSGPPGPFAVQEDRNRVRQRLETYIALADNADPRQLDYHVPALRSSVVVGQRAGGRAQLRAFALDDAGEWLAAELLLPATAEEKAAIRFFRLDHGFIAETMEVERAVRFKPSNGGPLPGRPEPTPAPDTARLPRMTETKFRDYLTLFSRFDQRFVDYYTPDVVFAAAPAQEPLQGRDAILSLYRPLRAALDENMTLHRLAIDNRSGVMIAALTNRLLAHDMVALPGRTLQRGDRLELSGAMIYGLREGRISLIRDVGG